MPQPNLNEGLIEVVNILSEIPYLTRSYQKANKLKIHTQNKRQ